MQVEKSKAPPIEMTKGALRAVALSYLSTPKLHGKGLVVVSSSLGSVQLDCEDDYRYQFSGQFGCLADQEKECSGWWQIVSFRGQEMENPKVCGGADAGVRGEWCGGLSLGAIHLDDVDDRWHQFGNDLE